VFLGTCERAMFYFYNFLSGQKQKKWDEEDDGEKVPKNNKGNSNMEIWGLGR